jgi:hypothetical protein
MNFNEALPKRASREWVLGVKESAWLKYFFFCWIFLFFFFLFSFFFLIDLCFDLFFHFLIYHKKQLRGIFIKNKD